MTMIIGGDCHLFRFRGLDRVRQHQLVNAAFGPRLGTELHALALTTKSP